MDPTAVVDAAKAFHGQILSPEDLQAALAVFAPGVSGASQVFTNLGLQQHVGQSLQNHSEQLSPSKQQAKRKVVRPSSEDVSTLGPPRPPAIKHEVYEDLEEKFQQLQSEREPKRHRGNPKGYQIKSFCKNPACGKQLNGGRTNRCEHCGFDLASHRRNAQLERLIKTGPLAHTQVRSLLRDAANEAHVRTGGKAMVLTLVYIDGAPSAPAQAIAYGKPAAAFVESRKDLITSFEAACREHFKDPQQPGHQQQQQQQPSQPLPAALLAPHLLTAGGLVAQAAISAAAAVATTAAQSAGVGSALPRTTTVLGSGSHHLLPSTAAHGAHGALQPGLTALTPAAAGAGASLAGLSQGLVSSAASVASGVPLPPVDLEAVIAAVVADPLTAVSRCREARLSGEVLCRLPQTLQLTVLMQAGLLAGEAASVVVEMESRLRPPLPPPPTTQVPPQSQPQLQGQAAGAVLPPVPPVLLPPQSMLQPYMDAHLQPQHAQQQLPALAPVLNGVLPHSTTHQQHHHHHHLQPPQHHQLPQPLSTGQHMHLLPPPSASAAAGTAADTAAGSMPGEGGGLPGAVAGYAAAGGGGGELGTHGGGGGVPSLLGSLGSLQGALMACAAAGAGAAAAGGDGALSAAAAGPLQGLLAAGGTMAGSLPAGTLAAPGAVAGFEAGQGPMGLQAPPPA